MHTGTAPSDRPRASWVMGRSARWHDPDLRAEIAAEEIATRRAPVGGLAVTAVAFTDPPTGPGAVWLAFLAVVRLAGVVVRAARALRG